MTVSAADKAAILECLKRSGYLLESRIVHALAQAGYFVEPNAAIIDSRTGKTREIDLVVENFSYDAAKPGVFVVSHFVIEVINNPFPLVLMTRYPSSPTEFMESYLRYATTPDPFPFLEAVDPLAEKGIYDARRYSQYCGISKKRQDNELMASHSDDLYSSLLKVAEYIAHTQREFEAQDWHGDDSARVWFWQGLLVIGGDLLALESGEGGEPSLEDIGRGALVFNFHVEGKAETVLIHVVHESELLGFLGEITTIDQKIAAVVYACRASKAIAT